MLQLFTFLVFICVLNCDWSPISCIYLTIQVKRALMWNLIYTAAQKLKIPCENFFFAALQELFCLLGKSGPILVQLFLYILQIQWEKTASGFFNFLLLNYTFEREIVYVHLCMMHAFFLEGLCVMFERGFAHSVLVSVSLQRKD